MHANKVALNCAFAQRVILTSAHKDLLRHLKESCGVSHSNAIRRGIELVVKEFEPVLKGKGINLEVSNGNG